MNTIKMLYAANPKETIFLATCIIACAACLAMFVVGIAAAWMETGERFEE